MISGGISTRLIFPGFSPESCKIFSDALGTTWERDPETKQERTWPLVTLDELRMLTAAS